MGDAEHRKAKLFADGRNRGLAAANPDQGTYEFGTELTHGGGLAALKNATYGQSGQQTAGARMGKQTR
ncbi:MAG TPA: hypothetical protein VNT01_15750 [Symbiobacteriaceae bacterium]|nr:hypothetical protein [Symbiobacteriaceae bacterium]